MRSVGDKVPKQVASCGSRWGSLHTELARTSDVGVERKLPVGDVQQSLQKSGKGRGKEEKTLGFGSGGPVRSGGEKALGREAPPVLEPLTA